MILGPTNTNGTDEGNNVRGPCLWIKYIIIVPLFLLQISLIRFMSMQTCYIYYTEYSLDFICVSLINYFSCFLDCNKVVFRICYCPDTLDSLLKWQFLQNSIFKQNISVLLQSLSTEGALTALLKYYNLLLNKYYYESNLARLNNLSKKDNKFLKTLRNISKLIGLCRLSHKRNS